MEKPLLFVDKMTMQTQNPSSENGFEVKDDLIFFSDLRNFSLQGTNLRSRHFLGEAILSTEGLSYLDLVHPEDHDRFRSHLEACKHLAPDSFLYIQLRLRDSSGQWEEFDFRHRSLRYDPNILLGLAVPAENHEQFPQNPTSENFHTENSKILVDSLDEGYCRIDLIFDLENHAIDFLYLETNPAFIKHLKFTDARGRTIKEFAPDYEKEWLEIFKNVLKNREPVRYERYASSVNQAWFSVYAFPIGTGEDSHVALLFSDVTQNKVAEKKLKDLNEKLEFRIERRTRELKENSDLLQTVFDISNQGIIVFEPVFEAGELVDFRYLLFNRIVRKQYRKIEMIGKKFSEINPDGKELGIFDAFKSTMLTGKSREFEILYDRQGFNNWFRFTAKRKNGLLITTLEDITKRKLESQRLKENIRFKKHLTGASPDIIMILNLYDENIRYINRDLAPLPGMRKKDALGKNLMEAVSFIHPRDRDKALDFHERVVQASDKDILEMEFRIRTNKGKYMWYNALGKVFMRNKNAKVYEYMVLLRNIDEHIETQKALLNAEKLSIKGEIARTIAHELRNPLASIGMASDLLQRNYGEKDKRAEKHINIIKRSSKVLNKLVTELLTSSSYTPAILEKKCLAQILEDSLKMAKDRIYLSGIRVKKNYTGPYYIHADEEKLKVALLNLIVNASEAMEPDTGVLRLSIQRAQDDFTLTVTDNGCGLTKDQLGKLFDAFYTQKPNGIGVGLSSVKNILEEHDAKIEVQSEPKKGTTFNLSFHCYENFERS